MFLVMSCHVFVMSGHVFVMSAFSARTHLGHDVGEQVDQLDVEEQVHDGDDVEGDGEGLAGVPERVEPALVRARLVQVHAGGGDGERQELRTGHGAGSSSTRGGWG